MSCPRGIFTEENTQQLSHIITLTPLSYDYAQRCGFSVISPFLRDHNIRILLQDRYELPSDSKRKQLIFNHRSGIYYGICEQLYTVYKIFVSRFVHFIQYNALYFHSAYLKITSSVHISVLSYKTILRRLAKNRIRKTPH